MTIILSMKYNFVMKITSEFIEIRRQGPQEHRKSKIPGKRHMEVNGWEYENFVDIK